MGLKGAATDHRHAPQNNGVPEDVPEGGGMDFTGV
jgi:hypothetical protein